MKTWWVVQAFSPCRHVQAFCVQSNVTHHHFPGKAGTSAWKKNDQWTQSPFKGCKILFVPDANSRYRSQRWEPAGIWNIFSHSTLIIASGNGFCANGRTMPEGTAAGKCPIPTHLIAVTLLAAYNYLGMNMMASCLLCISRKASSAVKTTWVLPLPLCRAPDKGLSITLWSHCSCAFCQWGQSLHHIWAVPHLITGIMSRQRVCLGWETEIGEKRCVGRALKSTEESQQLSSGTIPGWHWREVARMPPAPAIHSFASIA